MANSVLVASQLSAIFSSSQAEVVTVSTDRRDTPLPPAPLSSDPPSDHAIYATVFNSEYTGTIVLRVIDAGLTIELLSLTTNLPPIRFAFPAPLLPNPGIFSQDNEVDGSHEIHILAVTSSGSIFRLVLPASGDFRLWRQAFSRNWCREYMVKHGQGNLSGLVQVQGLYLIAIGLQNGSMLRLDAYTMGNEVEEDVWDENLFGQASFLSTISAFLNHGATGENEFVAITSHPQPTDNGAIVTVSRDRTVRLWTERGCVAARTLPAVAGARAMTPASNPRGMSPMSPPVAHSMLESGTQNLVRIFTHEESSQETPYAAVFNPTPTSTTSGGFFHMFGISGGHLASQSSIDCPSSTSHCTLQDFMVVGSTLYALWDKLGQSSIEKIALDVNHTRAGAVEGGVWQVASYASEPELTPAYLNQLLLEPGSMTDHLLSSILRPGSFSPLTLRTAIAQYTDACLSLPGTPAIQLRSSYSTINEKIAAVVGCTVKLARDPQTGAVEHDKYAQALKRDWEGFIARCREIERSARRPLAISVVGRDDVILVERERVGTAAGEDFTLQLQRCLHEGVPVNGPYALCEILWKLRAQLGVAVLAEMETATRDLVRQEIAFPYSDLLADQAQRIEFRQQLDPGFASWLDGRIAGVKDMDAAVRSVLDLLGGFDKSVKREEDEVALLLPLSNTEWTHGLAFSYAAATIESRYELTLALLAILFFLAEDLHQWQPSLLAEVLSIFRGISMLRLIARQPGAGPSQSTSHHHNADDISSRLQGMAVSGNGRQPGTPFVPTYALMHQLFAQGLVGVEPAAAAHQFMDNSGMLQSGSPAHATRLEVLFCERLRLLGYHYVAQELLSWLPKAPAASYVLARSWLDIGRADDAAHLIELVAGSFGEDTMLTREEADALAAVMPDAQIYEDDFEFYIATARMFAQVGETRWEVHFTQLAITVAPQEPELDLTPYWQALVKGYVDLTLWDDAYATIMVVPHDLERRRMVRSLVHRMCEENAVEKLMSFNFVGITNDVEEALSFKARTSDPRSRPFYSRILYSWYVGKNDYRNAALVMYQRARKLQEARVEMSQLLEMADMQREALVTALNAMALLDEKNAWFVLPSAPSTSQANKRRKLCRYIPDDKYVEGPRDTEYINVAQIQRELAFLTARLDILKKDPSLLDIASNDVITAEMMVSRLTTSGRYTTAINVAKSLEVDMNDIFSSLTEQCLRLSRRVTPTVTEGFSDWLLTDKVSSWPGTPADRGWRYLRQALERHDGPKSGWRYSQAVLDMLLAHNPSAAPPPWLVKILEDHQPENLIRTYFRYENWESTLEYALALIRKTADHLARVPPENAMAIWLPYSLIDQVVDALRDQVDLSPRAQALRTQLDTDLSNHVKRMQKLSQFKA